MAKKATDAPDGRSRVAPFAVLALIAFSIGIGVLFMLLKHAELLVRLGLIGNFYYVVLLALGLSAAAFLFGAMQSYAKYNGKVLGGALELGGPVVCFFLVVILGFYLLPRTDKLDLRVYVHRATGEQDIVREGVVWADLPSARREESINVKGEANFEGVPASDKGKSFRIWIESDDFTGSKTVTVDGNAVYLPVTLTLRTLQGRLLVDGSGQEAVKGAQLKRGNEVIAHTNDDGFFSAQFPKDTAPLLFVAEGFDNLQVAAEASSNATLRMHRKP
jgi:hypothetical protein